ncbi:MAG: hypothetical protein PW786_04700 [Arachidicoccus sp.]|nr:hypothetical protein [Arachidicoccus sp.]
MKSAYLYVRASAEQQKRKDNVLVKQEDSLVKYCEMSASRLKRYVKNIILQVTNQFHFTQNKKLQL